MSQEAPEPQKPPRKKRGRKGRKSPGVWPSREVMREIVRKKAGIIQQIADAIDMERRAVQRRVASDEEFRGWVMEAREQRLDLSESVVFGHIASKNLTAAIFHLKCQGKARGWVERQEVTGANGAELGAGLMDPARLTESIRDALTDPEVRQRMLELEEAIYARPIAKEEQRTGEDATVTRH